jgi:hypothetical protein
LQLTSCSFGKVYKPVTLFNICEPVLPKCWIVFSFTKETVHSIAVLLIRKQKIIVACKEMEHSQNAVLENIHKPARSCKVWKPVVPKLWIVLSFANEPLHSTAVLLFREQDIIISYKEMEHSQNAVFENVHKPARSCKVWKPIVPKWWTVFSFTNEPLHSTALLLFREQDIIFSCKEMEHWQNAVFENVHKPARSCKVWKPVVPKWWAVFSFANETKHSTAL